MMNLVIVLAGCLLPVAIIPLGVWLHDRWAEDGNPLSDSFFTLLGFALGSIFRGA